MSPAANAPGASPATGAIRPRHQAVQMYVDGLNLRRIGRLLSVDHQTIANWVAAHAETLPQTPPLPPTSSREPLGVCELDELYTFIGRKKTGPTSSRRSTGPRAVSSAGASLPTGKSPPSKP